MIKGICKDCIFSEDLSEGLHEGESLWICWAKRKEYNEPPQVCAQFQRKEDAATAAEEIAKVADEVLGLTPKDHISPDIEAPEFYASAKQAEQKIAPATEQKPPEEKPPVQEPPAEEGDQKKVTPATLDPKSLFSDIASPAQITPTPVVEEQLDVGEGAHKSFGAEITNPRAGNLISKSDLKPKSKSKIGVLLALLLLVLLCSYLFYIGFTPIGEKYDVLNLRPALLSFIGKHEAKKTPQTPLPPPAEAAKAPPPVEAPATPTTEAVAPPAQAPSTAQPAQPTQPEQAQAPAEPEKNPEKKFVGPVHKTPSYIIVETITSNKEEALAIYNRLFKKRFACGYLWIPDYASLSGQDRWMVFVGPFPTRKETEWRLKIYQRKVNPNAFGLRLDLEPIQERF